ncbi:BnaAnng25520D [Brassica napus]|uniref:BnaAnng25520D protein n=1 Tax=Brassica napus TaxID=3708 RepID=A0A078JM72_BRANA|nr:BnaAnng25520D [Brassica napus]
MRIFTYSAFISLGLSTEWSHHPLYSPGGLEVLDGVEKVLVDTPGISSPKNNLRPL